MAKVDYPGSPCWHCGSRAHDTADCKPSTAPTIKMGCPTCHSEKYEPCPYITDYDRGYRCENGHRFPQLTIWQEVAIEQENKL